MTRTKPGIPHTSWNREHRRGVVTGCLKKSLNVLVVFDILFLHTSSSGFIGVGKGIGIGIVGGAFVFF